MFRRSLIEQIIYIYYVKISEQKGTAQHEFVSKAALPLKFLAVRTVYVVTSISHFCEEAVLTFKLGVEDRAVLAEVVYAYDLRHEVALLGVHEL